MKTIIPTARTNLEDIANAIWETDKCACYNELELVFREETTKVSNSGESPLREEIEKVQVTKCNLP